LPPTPEDGFITFEEFRDLSQRFPLMLQPAFELQDKMHMCTLGLKGWVTVMENIAHAEKVKSSCNPNTEEQLKCN